jgi:hypothetical protein
MTVVGHRAMKRSLKSYARRGPGQVRGQMSSSGGLVKRSCPLTFRSLPILLELAFSSSPGRYYQMDHSHAVPSFSCRCLNVQISNEAASGSSSPLPSDDAYVATFAGEEGVRVVRA